LHAEKLQGCAESTVSFDVEINQFVIFSAGAI
jgi:hypothetical protein